MRGPGLDALEVEEWICEITFTLWGSQASRVRYPRGGGASRMRDSVSRSSVLTGGGESRLRLIFGVFVFRSPRPPL
jgi:hypothetical protein